MIGWLRRRRLVAWWVSKSLTGWRNDTWFQQEAARLYIDAHGSEDGR